MNALLVLIALVTIGFMGGFAVAQQAAPPTPPAPQTIPDWVVKYANNQEQAARACQLQLAQEQTKIDTLTKDLADAKSAAAAKPPAAEKK
jgi:invasion protein IalB